MVGFVFRAINAIAAFSAAVSALPEITQKGSKFFTPDGNQWFIKGVAYQLDPVDLGKDPSQCQRDAQLMKELGANMIRVYHVQVGVNHDECMQYFDDAGIYVFVDLDTFASTPEQTDPEWTTAQFGAFQLVMDDFQRYSNVAGFFIGNEIVNYVGPVTATMAYVKAATADMKAYRDARGYRKIPIGYSHADVAGLHPVLMNYLACGDSAQAIDFFGLNSYRWCGEQTYQQSGYQTLYEQTMDYPVPTFMSETGCNVGGSRTFEDQSALFGPMANVWSGSVIYEWIQEANHYGIVTYGCNPDASDTNCPGTIRSGTPTPVVPDFNNLKTQWATLHPTGVQEAAYNPTASTMACPAYTAGVWEVDPNLALPTLGLGVAIPTASAVLLANNGDSSLGTAAAAAAPLPTSAVIDAVSSGSSAIASASNSASSLRSSLQSSAQATASSLSASLSSAAASASGTNGVAVPTKAAGAVVAGLAGLVGAIFV